MQRRKILILNPDIILKNNAIFKMYSYLKENAEVGLCGSKLLNLDGTLQYSCRRFPSLINSLIRRTPLRFFFRNNNWEQSHLMSEWNHNESFYVDWVLGASMMIDRKLFLSVGMFDENFSYIVKILIYVID